MRFFSNEAKDNADEREAEAREQSPAEPAAVPQQRAGSPWHDSRDSGSEPVAKPVAVASSTVTRHNDDPDRTTPLPDGNDPDRTAPLPATHAGDNASAGPAGSGVSDHPAGHSGHAPAAWPAGAGAGHDDAADAALTDRGTFDDPHLTQPIPTGTPDARHTADRDARHTADRDHDGIPDGDEAKSTAAGHTPGKTVAEKLTDKVAAKKADDHTTETGRDEPRKTEPLIPAAPSSESTISGPAPFFPSSDTEPLRERWRDVQLRFVDDPKKAANEAAALVDEAVDKLAKALREQRGSLAKNTDDTESLRVELRSYRDILDRLLGL